MPFGRGGKKRWGFEVRLNNREDETKSEWQLSAWWASIEEYLQTNSEKIRAKCLRMWGGVGLQHPVEFGFGFDFKLLGPEY